MPKAYTVLGTGVALVGTLLLPVETTAQTSAELLKARPYDSFLSVKRSVDKTITEEQRDRSVLVCGQSFDSSAWVKLDTADAFATLARYLVRLEKEIAPFPRRLWVEDFLTLQREAVALVVARQTKEFDALVERTTAQLRTKLKDYIYKGRCIVKWKNVKTLDRVRVLIKAPPEVEEIRVTSPHKFDLCVDQNFSPIDFNKCTFWTHVPSTSRLAPGLYKVFIRWTDGKWTTDPYDMDTDTLDIPDGTDTRVFEVNNKPR